MCDKSLVVDKIAVSHSLGGSFPVVDLTVVGGVPGSAEGDLAAEDLGIYALRDRHIARGVTHKDNAAVGLHSLNETAESLGSTRALDSAVAETVAFLVICLESELLCKRKLLLADIDNADDTCTRLLCPSGGDESDRSRTPDNNRVAELYLETAYSGACDRTRLNQRCASVGKIVGKKNKVSDIYSEIFGKRTVAARSVVVIVFAVCKLTELAGSALAAGKKGEYSRTASDQGLVVGFNDLARKFVSGNGGEVLVIDAVVYCSPLFGIGQAQTYRADNPCHRRWI